MKRTDWHIKIEKFSKVEKHHLKVNINSESKDKTRTVVDKEKVKELYQTKQICFMEYRQIDRWLLEKNTFGLQNKKHQKERNKYKTDRKTEGKIRKEWQIYKRTDTKNEEYNWKW